MTPRQPARRGKVPNPTNESKDEEEQKARYSVGSTEYFLFFPTMRKEEKEPWQNVYSPPNPSPRSTTTDRSRPYRKTAPARFRGSALFLSNGLTEFRAAHGTK